LPRIPLSTPLIPHSWGDGRNAEALRPSARLWNPVVAVRVQGGYSLTVPTSHNARINSVIASHSPSRARRRRGNLRVRLSTVGRVESPVCTDGNPLANSPPIDPPGVTSAKLIPAKAGSGNPEQSSEGHASSWPRTPMRGHDRACPYDQLPVGLDVARRIRVPPHQCGRSQTKPANQDPQT
jgi:hypothetical protein